MDRRSFFGALASIVAAPAVPRRVYSFLWDTPLVRPASLDELIRLLETPPYVSDAEPLDAFAVFARPLFRRYFVPVLGDGLCEGNGSLFHLGGP